MTSLLAFFRHSRFQAPLARLRSDVSDLWRGLFAAIGRYRPMSRSETDIVKGDIVPFKGDIPVHAGDSHDQQRLFFSEKRPAFEEVENLVVTPAGGAWAEGALWEKYSAEKPGLRMLMADHKPRRTVQDGIFIQSEHVDTFGDWMSEYLASLAQLGAIDAPVFLPANMARKGYVARDGKRLGIDFTAIDEPLLIKRAKVVRQPKVIRYWTSEDASALQRLLKADAPAPEPGSLLYLSRHGEVSEVADRTYPNELVEETVRARGGKVLRTGETSLEDYMAAGCSAETVLLDHGSAGYNMAYWRPRRVIEFVSDDWWMNAFLFFADSLGVRDYTIICTDKPGVSARLQAALDRPVGG